MCCKVPSHRGPSLTAKVVLHGDPVWKASVAPAIQWANVVWRATTQPSMTSLSVRELVRIFQQVPLRSTAISYGGAAMARCTAC